MDIQHKNRPRCRGLIIPVWGSGRIMNDDDDDEEEDDDDEMMMR